MSKPIVLSLISPSLSVGAQWLVFVFRGIDHVSWLARLG